MQPQPQPQLHTQPQPPAGAGVYAIPYGVVPPPQAGAHFRQDLVAVVPPPPSRAQFDEILKHRYIHFSSSMYFRQAWSFVKHNACTLISALFCYLLLMIILEIINIRLVSIIFPIPKIHTPHKSSGPTDTTDDSLYYFHEDGSINTEAMTLPTHMDLYVERTITRMILIFAQSILILIPLHISAITTVFDAFRYNNTVMLSDLLGGKMTRSVYVRLLPLASILTIGNYILFWAFIIPGMLFAWYTSFCLPLFVDHGHYLSAWENIKTSAKLVHRYTCSLFFFWIQVVLLQFVGLLACGIGIILTSCIVAIAWIYCYHHILPINGVSIWVPRDSASIAHMQEAPSAENPHVHAHPHPQHAIPSMAVAVPYPAQAVWAQPAPAPYNIQHVHDDPLERRPLVQHQYDDVSPHPAMDAL